MRCYRNSTISVSCILAAITLVLFLNPNFAKAQQYFNGGGGVSTWDYVTPLWSSASGGPYNSAWGAYNDAVFEGTGGTVYAAGIGVNNLTFNVDGYVINGALTIGSPGGQGFTVNTGTATINATISHAGGYTDWSKNGTGTLNFGGVDNSSSTIYLNAGQLNILAGGSVTNLGTATQANGSNVTWNVNGTLATATVNLAPGNSVYYGGSNSGVMNVNSGGMVTATTVNMAFVNGGPYAEFVGHGYATLNVSSGGTLNATNVVMSNIGWGYQTASSTVNINGVVNAVNMQGGSSSYGYNSYVGRIVNVNPGGLLSATTIDFSQTAYWGGNTFNNQLNLNGGTLANQAGSNLTVDSTTQVTLNGSSTIATSSPYSTTINGAVGGTGALTMTGGGTLFLNGANSYTGPTAISGGTLRINGASAAFASSSVTNNGALVFNHSNQLVYPGIISGSGGLFMTGAGTLGLAAVHTYTGPTVIAAGTVQLQPAVGIGVQFAPNSGYYVSGLAGAYPLANWNSVSTPLSNTLGTLSSIHDTNGNTLGSLTVSYSSSSQDPAQGGPYGTNIQNLLNSGLTAHSGDSGGGYGKNAITISNIPYSAYNLYVYVSNWNGDAIQTDYLNVNQNANGYTAGTSVPFTTFPDSTQSSYTTGQVAAGGTPQVTDLEFSGMSAASLQLQWFPGNSIHVDGFEIVDAAAAGLGSLPTATPLSLASGGTFDLAGGNQQVGLLSDYTPGNGGSIINSATGTTSVLTLAPTGGSTTFSGTILGGGTLGSVSLVLSGSGIQVLAGANAYNAGTMVLGGTLQAGNVSAFSTGPVTVSGGVLDLAGYNVVTGAVTLASGTIINSGASAALYGTSYNLQSGTASVVLSGSGVLTKTTAGRALLTAANSYGGGTTISAGTLALGPVATLGSGIVSINPGGVLDVSAYGSGGYNFTSGVLSAGRTASFATDINGSLNVVGASITQPGPNSTMTVSGNLGLSNGTLAYNTADTIALGGALSLTGADYVIPTSALSAGTMTLFTYAGGTPNLADIATAGVFGSNPRQTYTFGISGGSAVTLAVTGVAGNLLWTGGSNSTWDTGLSQSWYNMSTGSADVFYSGDGVTFDDTAGTAHANVTISGSSGSVQPGTLTVSNTAVNYMFSGAPITGSTSLIKNGPGTLTLGSSNTFIGGTILNAGVLNANAAYALGTGTVTVSGGTLNANQAQSVASVTVSAGLLNLGNGSAIGTGPLTIGGGAINNTSGGPLVLATNNAQNWNGNFTFNGSNNLNMGNGSVALGTNVQVTVANNSLTVAGPISGGYGLTLAGAGTLVLTGTSSYSGATNISGGTLQLGDGTSGDDGLIASTAISNSSALVYNLFGSQTSAVVISGNGTVTKAGPGALVLTNTSGYTGNTTISGGTLQLGTGVSGQDGVLSATSGVIDNATLVYNVSSNQTAGYAIGGSGSLATLGVGTVVLTASNTYLGSTSILAGTLQADNGGSMGMVGPGPVAISAPAMFQIYRADNFSFGNTLSGAGTLYNQGSNVLTYTGTSTAFTGTINLNGGTLAVAPGASITNLGNATQNRETTVTWNVNGTLGATNFNVAPGQTTNYGSCVGTVNVNSGGNMIATTMNLATVTNFVGYSNATVNVNAGGTLTASTVNMAYIGYGYETSIATVNVNGVANVGTLQGFYTTGYYSSAQRYINVNAGGELNATTINLSQGGAYGGYSNGFTRQLNLNGGTLGNLAGTNLTVDSTTQVTLTGTSALSASYPNSITINGAIGGTGGIVTVGNGTYVFPVANSYSGGTRIAGGTLQLGNDSALGASSGALTVNSGALDLEGYNPTVSSLSGSAGAITNSSLSSPSALTIYQSNATTFSGAFNDGASSVGLYLNSGTLTLMGNNTHSGPTYVNYGAALIAGTANTLSPNSTLSLYGLLDVTAGSQTVAALSMSGGQLNMQAGNLLTCSGYSNLSGSINVFETTPGTAELISFQNSYAGTFTPGTLPAGYSLSYTPTELDLILSLANSAAWSSSLGGSWTGSSNWSPATVPNGQAVTALLGGALAASGTVTLDGAQTLGTLIFNNSTASYTLAAGVAGGLTLDNTGGTGSSQIIVLAGTHSITAPLTIANGPALVSLVNSGSLDISGDIGEAGGSHSLSLSSSDGTGMLSLGGSNSFTGGVYVNSGMLILNGAASLVPGSALTIGTTVPASMPSVLSSPAAAPSISLAPVPEPGTLTLFGVAALWSAIACYRFSKRPT